jgi:hypothetical protein
MDVAMDRELDLDALVADYLLVWVTSDNDLRRETLQRIWAPDGTYQDPTIRVEGREAFEEHLVGFHDRFPGAGFDLASRVDGYSDRFRFAWRLVGGDGAVKIEGVDIGGLDSQGRIASITGFFGPL